MISLVRAIAVILVVLLTASISGLSFLYNFAFAIIAIVVLCSVWAGLGVHWMQVKRSPRALRAQVGETVQEVFLVRNTSLLPRPWVAIQDRSTLPNHRVDRAFTLAPVGSIKWTVETVCNRRGKYVLGPCSVLTGDPFGLFSRSRLVREEHVLLVYPAMVDLPRFEIPVGQSSGSRAFPQTVQHVTPAASGIRDYVPGDSINRIHWLSTARHNRLMTKEFELDPTSDIWIVLDVERGVQAGIGNESTEEYGVTVAASIAKRFLSKNRAVGLVARGIRREVIHPDRGIRQLSRILESLALIRAEGKVPLAEVIAAEQVMFTANATVIAVTPSTDELWASSLREMAQRKVRTIAVVLEGKTFGGQGNSMLIVGVLAAAGIPSYLVKRGEPLGDVLQEPERR
ncbi:MAG: DUF58 domain-containing protein [Chloroflexi bacterium]|nr:DUF58 domain-containing protein [Chloroflexota bacterium]